MKTHTILLLVLALLIFFSCSGKKSTNPSEVEDTLLATLNVGAEGGTLSSEKFSLQIPAGAFTSQVELKLHSPEQQSPLGADAITDLFMVEGIPSEFSKPLRILLKHSTDISNEAAIAVGEKLYIKSLDLSQDAYQLVSAKDSAGYLVFQLPVPPISAANDLNLGKFLDQQISDETLYFQGSDFITSVLSSQGHFKIETTLKSINKNSLTELGNHLEEAYSILKTLGFEHEEKRDYPVDVTVLPLDDDKYGYYSYSMFYGGYLEFNSKKITEAEELRLTAGHEFFHLVQGLYDNRSAYSKAKFSSDYEWLDEATAVWIEEKFTTTPNFVSSVRSGNEMAPFNGAEKGAAENARYHGYGMSSAIKYLTAQYGEDKLVQIYKHIFSGSKPVAAIEKGTEGASVWYGTFLRDYILGNLYGLLPSFWVSRVHGEFSIDTDSDTLETFTDQFPDLSGRLYRIALNYADIDSSATLEFTASGGENEITVFKYKSRTIQYLNSESENLSIPDVRIMKDEGWHLIALVTNKRSVSPYTESSEINLEIRLKEPPEFNECFVDLTAKGTFQRRFHAYQDSVKNYENQTIWQVSAFPEGKFKGNTFNATWDTTHTDGWFERGTMTAKVNEAWDMVTEVTINETFGYPEGHVIYSETVYTFKIENIPFDSEWMGVLGYEVSGVQTCSAITQLDLTTTTDYYTETLIEYICDEDSEIDVEFWSPLEGLKKTIERERRERIVKQRKRIAE
ncbi:hypothetical protein GF337_18000 [candidate division KSB1 bacterium]|nr:hypothetical protein [candidate division KSB1 bacterium]